jgi:hypothetical protein
MRWIQIFMMMVALIDIYPDITSAGYGCEMSFTDSRDGLGTFSQVLCWLGDSLNPWTICRHNALASFCTEFVEQIALFFGLVLTSAPKPSISYVRVTQFLFGFSLAERVVRLIYYSVALNQGVSFLKESTSCVFSSSFHDEDGAEMKEESLRNIIFILLSAVFYSAYIWGASALMKVLKKGGTGDERVAGDDILSIVRRDPPHILVMSSAFGLMPLRSAAIVISMGLAGLCFFNGFNNIYRMSNFCGTFEMESTWCIWPFGVLSTMDQALCLGICLYTTKCLLELKKETRFSSLTKWWAYLSLSSFALVISSVYIVSEHYPSYYMDGMKSDVWIYYTRFWLSLTQVAVLHSISVVRLAGGRGSEDPDIAEDLIYEKLSAEHGKDVVSDTDSLADLFGSGPSGSYKDDAGLDSYSASSSEEETSGIRTPKINGFSGIAMGNQAMDGLQVGTHVPGN